MVVLALTHGTRTCYQRVGCPCVSCRSAEATYRSGLRRRYVEGRPILGAHVPATEARKRVRLLVGEGFSRAEIGRRIGIHDRTLFHGPQVTVRKLLHLRRLYRTVMFDAYPEAR